MCPIKAGCWQCKTINVNLWASCYKCATGSCNFNELVCTYEVYFVLNTRIHAPSKKNTFRNSDLWDLSWRSGLTNSLASILFFLNLAITHLLSEVYTSRQGWWPFYPQQCDWETIRNSPNSVREGRKYFITKRVCGQDLYPGQVQVLMNVIFLSHYFTIFGRVPGKALLKCEKSIVILNLNQG